MTLQASRRLRRFFSKSPLPEKGGEILLSSEQTHHLRHLIRLKPGDACLLVDPSGAEAEACILRFLRGGETLLQVETKKNRTPSPARLYLQVFAALPQRGKPDELVEKAQELGVEELSFLETERTVVKMAGAGKQRALARWQKIAEEAAKQSGSFPLTKIVPSLTFQEALGNLSFSEPAALFHPDPQGLPFSEWALALRPGSKVGLFIGPEGGFSDSEVKSFRAYAAGALTHPVVRLGDSILKTETAFLGVISSLRFLYP